MVLLSHPFAYFAKGWGTRFSCACSGKAGLDLQGFSRTSFVRVLRLRAFGASLRMTSLVNHCMKFGGRSFAGWPRCLLGSGLSLNSSFEAPWPKSDNGSHDVVFVLPLIMTCWT